MSIKKIKTTLMILCGCFLLTSEAWSWPLPRHLQFEGQFSSVVIEGEGCDEDIPNQPLLVDHFRAGANGLVSVIHFGDIDSGTNDSGAVLDGLNLFGNLGYNQEFIVSKDFATAEGTFSVYAEGIVDVNFLLMEVSISRIDELGFTICWSKGEFFGND